MSREVLCSPEGPHGGHGALGSSASSGPAQGLGAGPTGAPPALLLCNLCRNPRGGEGDELRALQSEDS